MRIERKLGAGVAMLGSLLLAVGGAAPVLAGSGHSVGLSHVTGLRFANLANSTSTHFAGWAFKPSPVATSVTAEYRVPTLKCTSTTSGVAPISVMLTGTSTATKFNAAGLLLECSGGAPAAAPLVVVDGTASVGTNPITVGDLIKTTITTSATKTTATVSDLTVGHTFKLTKSGIGAASLEELIIDDSLVTSTGTQLPVANFGKISFTNGAVGGKPLGMVSPRVAVNMETAAKVLQILTGSLTGTKLNAFLTTFKHS